MKLKFWAASLTFVFLPLSTLRAAPTTAPPAEVLSTETLRSFCGSKDDDLRRICSFYVLGVVQGVAIGASPDADARVKCIQDDLSAADAVAAFMSVSGALKIAYPSDMASPAVSIVSVAVASKFPCNSPVSAKSKQ